MVVRARIRDIFSSGKMVVDLFTDYQEQARLELLLESIWKNIAMILHQVLK